MKVDEQEDIEGALDLSRVVGYEIRDVLQNHRAELVDLSGEALLNFRADLDGRIEDYIDEFTGYKPEE